MNQSKTDLVLDASVGTQWFLRDEVDAPRAAALLDAFSEGAVQLVAPDHIRYEVASALRVATRTSPPRLSEEQAEAAIIAFQSLHIPLIADDDLITAGFRAAGAYGCAFYDGLYVALAERTGFPLITSDRRLYLRIRNLPSALWLPDWQAPP